MLQEPLSSSSHWEPDRPSVIPAQGPRPDMQSHIVSIPPRPGSQAGPRPSSRRALTAALELAQEAVRLDTTNDDPIGAIQAYGRSVALLSEVMERVMRGDDSNDSGRRRGGRRRSVVAKEEEVRRLKSIHDTYADRMHMLSDIYHIDPNNPVTFLTDSNTDSSDNGSEFPQSRGVTYHAEELSEGLDYLRSPSRSSSTPDSSGASSENTFTTDHSLPEFEMVNPPSMQPAMHPGSSLPPHVPITLTGTSGSTRASALPPPRPPPSGPLPHRPRNSSLSVLPPPAPPPRVAPPPPPSIHPSIVEPGDFSHSALATSAQTTRSRGNSSTHKRTGSGNRLEALQEEPDLQIPIRGVTEQPVQGNLYYRHPNDPITYPRHHPVDEDEYRAAITRPPSKYLLATQTQPPPPLSTKESLPPLPPSTSPSPPPLPPTPPPATPHASPMTPRGIQPHPFAAQDSMPNVPRARGISTPTFRTDGNSATAQLIINPNTTSGTISQRRTKSSTGTISSQSSSRTPPPEVTAPGPSTMPPTSQTPPMNRLNASSLPASTANSLGLGRSRSSSQPLRPALMSANSAPSEFGVRTSGPLSSNLPSIPRKPSFPSRLNPAVQASNAFPATPATSSSYLPSSPLPTAQPLDPLRKPYHMMSLLRVTMTSKTGGYITRRLHVPPGVWSQGGAKLMNLPEKVRVVEILCGALEEIQNASNELTSGAAVSVAPSAGGRKDVERWLAKLDDWSGACESVVGSAGKKLGIGEGFGAKKSGGVTSWSGKVARSFDRMTNGKNLDSPASYVLSLSRLFQQAQILDEHTKALNSSPVTSLYASIPSDLRQALELKLKRSSEFFASVVLTFVVRDLFQLLDKYVKKGEKWLVE